MPFCTNCGAQLDVNQKFCSKCGAKVEPLPEEEAPAKEEDSPASGADDSPQTSVIGQIHEAPQVEEAPETKVEEVVAPTPAKTEVKPEPPATQADVEAPSSTTVLAGQKFEEKKKPTEEPKDEFAEFNKEPTFTLKDADGRTFSTTTFPCVFGKGTAAGVQISGNNAISREHISVTFENKKFFIEDLNSSNFTYVNGRQVDAKTKAQVTTGDDLKLADELFTVQVDF